MGAFSLIVVINLLNSVSMEASYSNLDNVSSNLNEAEIVWLDHCYAASKQADRGGGSFTCPWKQEVKKEEPDITKTEPLTILPFKSKKSTSISKVNVTPVRNEAQRKLDSSNESNQSSTITRKTVEKPLVYSNNNLQTMNDTIDEQSRASKSVQKLKPMTERPKHILRASYFSATDSEDIDIVNSNDAKTVACENSALNYDNMKLRVSLSEMERSVRFIRKADPGVNWESKADKSDWSNMQLSLFKQVSCLLAEDTLKRNIYQNDPTSGSIHVLNIIRQSSQKLRDIYAGFFSGTLISLIGFISFSAIV